MCFFFVKFLFLVFELLVWIVREGIVNLWGGMFVGEYFGFLGDVWGGR